MQEETGLQADREHRIFGSFSAGSVTGDADVTAAGDPVWCCTLPQVMELL